MFNKDIVLEGETVCLVPYEAQYLEEYYHLMQDKKQLAKLTNVEPNLSLSDFLRLQDEWSDDQFQQCLLIQKKHNKKIVGDVNFVHRQEMGDDHVEIQIILAH